MSNEPQQKPQLTRIPLDQIWFTIGQEQDLPGAGNSQLQSVLLGRSTIKGRQFFLGFFVPSYQVVDIEWYRNDEVAEPEVFSIPMTAVRKIKRMVGKK